MRESSSPPGRCLFTRRGAIIAACACAGALCLAGTACAADPAAPEAEKPYAHPSAARVVAQLTGAKGFTNTAQIMKIQGTDLGIMWDDGDGHVLFAVGDTFGEWSGNGGGGEDWRSNALLRSSTRNFAEDGILFDSAVVDENGKAREIIPSLKIPETEHTTIPTGGIAVGGRQYLAFMSVNKWGVPGEWFTNYSRIAYSDDGGETWNTTDGPQWTNDDKWSNNFQMVGFAHGQGDGFVYMMGTPNGRFGAIRIARVDENKILEKDAYQYWNGSEWGDDEAAAADIVEAPTTELSLQYNSYLNKWMLMYTTDSDEAGIFDVVYRLADRPEGPWSDKTVVATSLDYPGMYAPYMHPWNSGSEVHFAMSIWGSYNIFQMAFEVDKNGNLIHPNLLKDPGFERVENGGMSPHWQCHGPCGLDDKPDWAYGSEHQAWMRNNQGTLELSQTVTVTPNTHYKMTAFVTTGPDNPQRTDKATVGARQTGPGGQVLASQEFTHVAGYTRFVVEFDSGSNSQIDIFVDAAPTADQWVQMDSLSLKATGPSKSDTKPADGDANADADAGKDEGGNADAGSGKGEGNLGGDVNRPENGNGGKAGAASAQAGYRATVARTGSTVGSLVPALVGISLIGGLSVIAARRRQAR